MNQKELSGPIVSEPKNELQAAVLETVLLQGDLGKLGSDGRVKYMTAVCESLGLNPLTKPFEFIQLNGRTVMYAKKDCTEQLRRIHGVSITIVGREIVEGCYIVTARAQDKSGRHDESVGAVSVDRLGGENRANAIMKAETKAKRRVTLSICGLGMLDETEVETIPGRVDYTPPEPAVAEVRAAVEQDPPKREVAGNALPARDVPALPGDQPVADGQVQRIHVLRGELPGWSGDHSHPEHMYSKALRAYKKADGEPVMSSKELTFAQAKNLITRMQGLADRKARAFQKMEDATQLPDGMRPD